MTERRHLLISVTGGIALGVLGVAIATVLAPQLGAMGGFGAGLVFTLTSSFALEMLVLDR